MTLQPQDNLNNADIEQMMFEVAEARQAGVFGRTTIDFDAVLAEPTENRTTWIGRHRHALMGMSAVACLAIVVTLGTTTSTPTNSAGISASMDMHSPMETVVASAPVVCYSAENLAGCLTGPGIAASPECSCADIDNDGDVDLQDFRDLQLAGVSDYQ